MLSLKAGTTLGPYQILKALGYPGQTLRPWCPGHRSELRGNKAREESASVYMAHSVISGRSKSVALKVLPADCIHHAECAMRFQRQAQVQALVGHLAVGASHPNIVLIYDFGESSGMLYLSMPLITGSTLASLLARGPLEVSRGLRILRSVGEAIDHVHDRGVVHRNVATQNILLDEAHVAHLGDFCVATTLLEPVIRTGVITGTPPYMAPEQVIGSTADRRSDVYALGVVAYEMLSGRPPFNGANVLHKIVREQAPPPRQWDNRLPTSYNEIFACALAKNPDERYQSAGALVKALEQGLP